MRGCLRLPQRHGGGFRARGSPQTAPPPSQILSKLGGGNDAPALNPAAAAAVRNRRDRPGRAGARLSDLRGPDGPEVQ